MYLERQALDIADKYEDNKKGLSLPDDIKAPITSNVQEKVEGVKLELISNEYFLRTYPKVSDRFSKLTNPSLKKNDIVNGSDISITFTHNGIFNRSLYMQTTAGQSLPSKIRTVTVKGEEYTRLHNSISGEFYNANNKRLTIHEGTQIKTTEVLGQEGLNLLVNSDSTLSGVDAEIERIAKSKGVDYVMLQTITKAQISDANTPEERFLILELFATEISRGLSRELFQKGEKYSLHLSAKILKKTAPDSWNSKLATYGYEETKIAEYAKNSSFGNSRFDLGSLSAEYESGSMGSYAYNPDDNGSPSYGTYQLHADAFTDFCKENNIVPVNRNGWNKKVAELGLSKFQAKEHEFIKKTHFDLMMNQIKPEYASKFGIVLQNVIWSTSVQHGPHRKSFAKVINQFDFTPGEINSEKRLVKAIYNERARLYPEGISRYNKESENAINQLTNSNNNLAMV